MKYYNKQYKILFNFNPIFECMLGQFKGWRILLQLFNDSENYNGVEKVNFTYNKGYNKKLLKYLKTLEG